MLARTPENTQNTKIVKIFCFMLRTNLATRRTVVRLRASKKALLFLLGKDSCIIFSYPLKMSCKKLGFFTAHLLRFYSVFTFYTSENYLY